MGGLKKLFLLLIILAAISAVSARKLYHYFVGPLKATASAQIFVVPKGATGEEIAARLKKEGLIRNTSAFRWVLKRSGLEKKIQPGDFRLSATMSAYQIALQLTSPLDVWITIPEGWRVEEIGENLVARFQTPSSKFDQEEFLAEAKPQEGFLFPDTYLVPKTASASAIIRILSHNFTRRVDDELREEMFRQGWTLYEVINLASIVEREVRLDGDRPVVAGILLKRLKAGMALQADATVQYAKATLNCRWVPKGCDWWPKEITKADLQMDSPYNTRKFAGLPPTPICNPGLASTKAVVFPEETDYWYYLSDGEGRMHYGVTLEEHNRNIESYL